MQKSVSQVEKEADLADLQASVQFLKLNIPTDTMTDTVVKNILPYQKVENSTKTYKGILLVLVVVWQNW